MLDLLCLLEFYNTYSHEDIYFEVVKKMIKEFDMLRMMGTQELADHLFISPATLYRFVKVMYYNNHKEMRGAAPGFFRKLFQRWKIFPKGGHSRLWNTL